MYLSVQYPNCGVEISNTTYSSPRPIVARWHDISHFFYITPITSSEITSLFYNIGIGIKKKFNKHKNDKNFYDGENSI